MRLRRGHLFHSAVVLVVLVLLAFGGAFLADALDTSTPYDALVAQRVAVSDHVLGCFPAPTRTGYVSLTCQVAYAYKGEQFEAWIPRTFSSVFYVDPLDTSYRMNRTAFLHAAESVDGDRALAIALFAAAALVTAVHQYHLFTRRRQLKSFLAHTDRVRAAARVSTSGPRAHR